MNRKAFSIYCVLFAILTISNLSYSQSKEYTSDWDELRSRPYPQWFKDAKLGIFIHWGVYSVPAYGGKESYSEWYLRGLQVNDSLRTNFMKKNYGGNFEYNDFAPLFKAELFDPDEWADIFKRAGARYVVLVSKHHDGYCLWPSKYSRNWNSVDIGPKRDLVGDLTSSVRKAGLKMGLYYSLPEWNHPLHRWYTDPHKNVTNYVEQYMIPQFKELVSAYKPSVLFADGEWFNSAREWHAAELISWYYNLVGDDAIVNNRWGGGSNIGFLTPEYSAGIKVTDRPWAEVRGLGRSFGLNRNEKLDAYMTPEELIHFFVKAVANGGGMILNVGPQADGQIPLLQQDRLIALGDWLKVNGEAIYGSTAWTKQGQEREVQLERVDPQINFNWVRNTPGHPIKEDDFTVTWNGFIAPRYSEEYLFEARADDGIRVWINDKLLINKWEGAPAGADGNVMENNNINQENGKIKLKAGKKYKIRISYFEKKQNAGIQLYWSSQRQAKEIVPQSQLFTTAQKETGDGLSGVYKSMRQYLAFTQKEGDVYAVTLEWPDDALILEVKEPNKSATVSLVGRQGNLPWKYERGKMIVDVSMIKYSEMPCKDAWSFKITGL
ncbi:alpha-L-fucosidase [Fulvivirgaceae bacterium BMA10]|uniref:alpha-L-fucosidase n=1 Tax=Splendidivirga corallicola TaxID=3051826 RepID=A0ABT8KZH6_9BACT|nr:alpha-L-fucosidase [Fulvivirgaceae bacterium BMA10]